MALSSVRFPRTVTLSGLTVAGVGFLLTRFTVTLAAYDQPAAFYLAGLLPLVLGLLLSSFGIALVVGPFDPAFARTTAVWCLVGAGAMLVLVVLTLFGSEPDGVWPMLSRAYLSNFLIGGSIGGTLTGVYAARTERQRGELRRQANRLVTLNRILRHEVLNSITAISGYADVIAERESDSADGRSVEVIRRRSDHIVDTMEDVQYLTESTRSAETGLGTVDLLACLEASVASVWERYPDAEFVVRDGDVESVPVWANSQLERLFGHLFENAVEHNDTEPPRVQVDVETDSNRAVVRVADNGPGLPERERSILEDGVVADHDDPSSGFGINVVRLLVERFRGTAETRVTESGTVVEVTLMRAAESSSPTTVTATGQRYGVRPRNLAVAVGAALVAGGVMGAFSQAVSGAVPIIGALYGATDPVVGWITHEFHSVVFGMTFAGLLTLVPTERADGPVGYVFGAVAWALFLWAVASGVVMPVWLRLVGIPASVPNLGATALAGHLVWGVTLGGLYYLGTVWLGSRAGD